MRTAIGGGDDWARELVYDFLTRNLSLRPEEISPASKLDYLGLDSQDVVELAMVLQDEHGVEIKHSGRRILTVRDMIDWVSDCRRG